MNLPKIWWSKKMKKCLILLPFFFATAAAAECTEKELEALKNLQAQLLAVCGAVDFKKLPEELKTQGFEEQCQTLGSREITAESCAALKVELEKNAPSLISPAPAKK